MAEAKTNYQTLVDLYNNVDSKFYEYQTLVSKLFEAFIDGFSEYIGCPHKIGYADIKDIKIGYDYSRNYKPIFNSIDYNQDTGFWTLLISIKLSTTNPISLAFNLSIYNNINTGEKKLSIEEIKYKLELTKDDNLDTAFKATYEKVFNIYCEKEKEIITNGFIHYDNKLRTIGF